MEAEEVTKAIGGGWERAMGGRCEGESAGACTWQERNGRQGEIHTYLLVYE